MIGIITKNPCLRHEHVTFNPFQSLPLSGVAPRTQSDSEMMQERSLRMEQIIISRSHLNGIWWRYNYNVGRMGTLFWNMNLLIEL